MRRRLLLLASGDGSQTAVVVTAIVLILLPLAVLRTQIAEYSTAGIIVACLAIFWFAILALRSCRPD